MLGSCTIKISSLAAKKDKSLWDLAIFGGQGANSEFEDFSCDPSMTEQWEECRIASPDPRKCSWSATVLTEERLLTRWADERSVRVAVRGWKDLGQLWLPL